MFQCMIFFLAPSISFPALSFFEFLAFTTDSAVRSSGWKEKMLKN